MRLISFRQVLSNVRLYIADSFIDDNEIEHLLRFGEEAEKQPDSSAKHDYTGFSFEMRRDGNRVLNAVFARMEAAFGFANSRGASMRFRRYHPGEYHPLHCDNYEIANHYLVATAMMWLTDTESGGETRFPNCLPMPLILQPQAGRLAVWLNYRADGSVDRSAMHEALPVVRGSKVTLTNFVYSKIDAIPAFSVGLTKEADIPGLRFEPVLSGT